jgi:hypothetical protein
MERVYRITNASVLRRFTLQKRMQSVHLFKMATALSICNKIRNKLQIFMPPRDRARQKESINGLLR